MRAFLRLLPLAAFAAVLNPAAADAQRGPDIPPLYVQPVARPDTTTPDTVGLRFRIGQAPERGRERQPVAPSTQLAAADASRILARLPVLAAPAAADSFAFPARTLPPPRTGRVLLAAFPPPDTTAPPRPSGPRTPAALTLVRAAPRGEVDVAAEVTVTFSQPMVPLSSVGAVQGRPVPVRLSPQPAGSWRWIDVRTLVFTPRGRMPASTEYTVTVPAGTQAETGGRMAEAASWTFRTQRLSAIGGQPHRNDVGLEPLIVIRFDQRIDPAAVLPHVRLLAGDAGVRVPLRLATAEEIQADGWARTLAEHGDSVYWLAARPVRPLPRDTRVQVRVEPGAPSLEGPLPTGIAQSWSFRTYGPLRVQRVGCGAGEVCRPGEPIVVELTTRADAPRAGWVGVEPAIPGVDVEAYGNSLVIRGATRPLTRYTIRLSGDLRDVHGQTLGEPRTYTVQVGTAVPGITAFNDRIIVLDPSGPRRISTTSHDHARLRIRIHRVEPSDWPRFVAHHGQGYRSGRASVPLPGREVANRVVQVEGETGELTETEIALDEALGGRPGHLIVGVEAVDGVESEARDQASYVWVQSTRIGLAAFADPRAVTAWATSLVDGAPLPGIRVSVSGQPVSGATDAGGVAELPPPGRPVVDEAAYVVAERDGDRALLPLARNWSDEPRETVLWYGLTDRNLYRPGEEVRFKGWARRFERSKTGGLRLPGAADAQVAWRVLDPRGNEVARGAAPLTALGGFDGVFRVPEGSNLGYGMVELKLRVDGREEQGAIPFQVQEFRRPEFEVGMDAPAGPHVVGGSAELAVRASYFAGGGLAGAQVSWTVTSTHASFTPPGASPSGWRPRSHRTTPPS